jgi:hypothetical protein
MCSARSPQLCFRASLGLQLDVIFSFSILFLGTYLPLKYCQIFLYPLYFSPYRHLPTAALNTPFFGQALNFVRAKSPIELYVKWMRQHPNASVIRYLTFRNTEVCR